jgi:iron complex outermembrane recepter protein
MKHRIIHTIVLSLLLVQASAQKALKGKVIDAGTGKPLAGASIVFGNGGTVTDKDGSFSVDCSKAASLTISFVGYSTQVQRIRNCDITVIISLQPTGSHLDEVEITASSNPNKTILYQPVSLTKLNQVELKRGTGLFLDDAIQTNVPGVTMNRRTVSGGQQFNIRGYGNGSRGTRGISSNFDGQGYKVYLNGIPVTDAEGITTLDDIDFASIGDVEVTKGPAGTLYGLAIAGAVNLKTAKAERGKTSISQEVLLGNYGLQRYTTSLQKGSDRSSIILNYGHQHSDGASIHNESKKDFVNFAADFQPAARQNISAYVGYSDSYDQRLGELTIAQWNANDYSGNPEYIKRDAHSNVITFRAGVGHTYQFADKISNSTSIFGTGFNSNVSSAGGWTDKTAVNYGLRSVFNTGFHLRNGITLNGITGIEAQRQDAQTIGYNMKQNAKDTSSAWSPGKPYWVINANTSNVTTISKTYSLFTEWTLGLMHDFSITAGIGSSAMGIILNDRFNPEIATRPARFDTSYKNMWSPHFAINKVFNKQVSVYASYSRGYKAPVSAYFFITTPAVATTPLTPATGRVNEVLKPEVGDQYEAGTKGQLLGNRLSYELAYFHAIFANKMTAVAVSSPLSPNTTLYSYVVNGGKQKHNGVEALVKFTVLERNSGFFRMIHPFANITYSDFKYSDNFKIQKSPTVTEDYSNKEVAGVSKIVANVGADFQMSGGLYANVIYNYRDRQPITSLNDLYASSYNLLSAKLGLRQNLGAHFAIDVYAGAVNLTNTRYYFMVFANQLPDAYIPAPRHTQAYGGINLKYNF